jgi:hypothetical protein
MDKSLTKERNYVRKATKTVATWMGLTAGFAAIEHGYFEILQGSVRPEGVMILSIGPPCDPEISWNTCEPAMTILPNFLYSGIISVVVGVLIMILAAGFMQRKRSGLIMILLNVVSLLFGGGFFPPLIGIVGGVAGLNIQKPITREKVGPVLGFIAALWPWPLVIFEVWTLGQIPFGYFANDLLKSIMFYGIALIFITLPLSVWSGYGRDVKDTVSGV